jgi:hypothetical protein
MLVQMVIGELAISMLSDVVDLSILKPFSFRLKSVHPDPAPKRGKIISESGNMKCPIQLEGLLYIGLLC